MATALAEVTDPRLPGQLAAVFGRPHRVWPHRVWPHRVWPHRLWRHRLWRHRSVTVDTLTLAGAISYFTGQRPADPRVRANALLSAAHPRGYLVFQVFLDEADRVCADASGTPYGRQVIARRLDGELLDYLGGGDLLIFR
jgi:hypothetical protein